MSVKNNRRAALKMIGSAAAGLVIGGLAGYYMKGPEIIEKTFTTTVKETVTTLVTSPVATAATTTLPGIRVREPREPAPPGESPFKGLPLEFPGIGSVSDIVPKAKYYLALSNCSLEADWRILFEKWFVDWMSEFGKRFGTKFTHVNAYGDAAKQLRDVEALIATHPDILIMTALEAAPLDPVADLAEKEKVPLFMIDREIVRPPKSNPYYLAHFAWDDVFNGVQNGFMIAEYLRETYGEPIGHVVEITGLMGATPAKYRASGLRFTLENFPDIRIIDCRDGKWETKAAYEIMRDWLELYPKNYINVLNAHNDPEGMGAKEAMKERGREEIAITSHDGYVEALKATLNWEETKWLGVAEFGPAFAIPAISYAIKYLNGEFDFPQPYYEVKARYFTGRDPTMKRWLEENIPKAETEKAIFLPLEWGGLKESEGISARKEALKVYQIPYYEKDSPVRKIFENPYATQKPLEKWPA